MALILYVLSIVCAALGDAFNDTKRKVWGHSLNALSVLFLLIYPLIIADINILHIVLYILLRISIFDTTYNIGRGDVPWYYIGNSSLWDKFFKKWPPMLLLFFRLIILTSAITVFISYI